MTISGAGAEAAVGGAGAALLAPGFTVAAGLAVGLPGFAPGPPGFAAGAAVFAALGAAGLVSALGIVIGALHFGHGPCLPANFSLTVNLALQLGQVTAIGMRKGSNEKRKDSDSDSLPACGPEGNSRPQSGRAAKLRLQFPSVCMRRG